MNRPHIPVLDPAQAADCLRAGAVIVYPTEGVWGLGCDPFAEAAVRRLLAIKQRQVEKGVILIAARPDQLDAIVDWAGLDPKRRDAVLATWPGPHTWIVPVLGGVPRWITGMHDSVAVRVSAHPSVRALCTAFGGPLVSTSANVSTQPPARNRDALDPALLAQIDALLEGETGGLEGPTPIRDAISGEALRL
ncbi:MAG: tRNA threonylcarbamoyladenosine biosynthesis protein RimN [Lysobacteraceae bacterium]|nr:MAG: tRNA threonylcarbamoyladenosine biosynthesis protein RimN [Xanthomonadaceae bacterium]